MENTIDITIATQYPKTDLNHMKTFKNISI